MYGFKIWVVTQGQCNDAIRLSIYEFLLMTYGNLMSISHRLEVITGQLTIDRLNPTMPRMTPRRHWTVKGQRCPICSMRVALVFSRVLQIGVHDWTRDGSAYASAYPQPYVVATAYRAIYRSFDFYVVASDLVSRSYDIYVAESTFMSWLRLW